ncbi:MAG: metallophosphoesterase [Synechococcaceae cyanobacterium]|nr:metallophosphoesterase [Synechococcaceae cyanobacterium]
MAPPPDRDEAPPWRLRRRRFGQLLLAPLLPLFQLLPVRADPSSAKERELRWFALGDSGSGDASQLAVAELMAARHRDQPVDLVIHAGDVLYDHRADALERVVRRPYAPLLAAGVPFHAVLGNHDLGSDGGRTVLGAPELGMAGRWYSFVRGPVRFVMLDTNTDARWQHQLPWLKRTLGGNRSTWIVVVGHHPILSSGLYGDDPAAHARLAPLFAAHGVQLYVNGHDHHYERSLPRHGTTYLTVGGGGSVLRPVLARPGSAAAVSRHSIVEIRNGPTTLELRAWDTQQRLIDTATLNADGSLVATTQPQAVPS